MFLYTTTIHKSYYYLLLSTTVYYNLFLTYLLLPTICFHLKPSTLGEKYLRYMRCPIKHISTIYYYIRISIIIYYYLLVSTTIYYHPLISTTIYYNLLLYTTISPTIYYYLFPPTTIKYPISVTTYYLLVSITYNPLQFSNDRYYSLLLFIDTYYSQSTIFISKCLLNSLFKTSFLILLQIQTILYILVSGFW